MFVFYYVFWYLISIFDKELKEHLRAVAGAYSTVDRNFYMCVFVVGTQTVIICRYLHRVRTINSTQNQHKSIDFTTWKHTSYTDGHKRFIIIKQLKKN